MTNHTDICISSKADIRIKRVTAPLDTETVWEIESFLLKIFEYGDYSFRSALSGKYHQTLNCTFFLANYNDFLIGAAGCLYAHNNPAVSIIGPVCVDAKFRRNGIGTKLISYAVEFLKTRGCKAVYLAVAADSPAVSFYKKLGFQKYKGVVMRRLFSSEEIFGDCFNKSDDTNIRRVVWGDFPAVQALASFPAGICTFDFRRSIFSSRYVPPSTFLSFFPEMMKAFARYGGFANVLVSGYKETVVGIAHISKLPGKAQQHIAELDFFAHDNFIKHAQTLVDKTIEESRSLSIDRINCYCLACDRLKRSIFESLGARQIAVLPANVRINENLVDVLIYEMRGHNAAY